MTHEVLVGFLDDGDGEFEGVDEFALHPKLERYRGSAIVAAAAALVLQLNPAFWINSIYGFPTMVALSLFMLSATTLQSAFFAGANKPNRGLLVLAFATYCREWIWTSLRVGCRGLPTNSENTRR